MSSTDDYQSDRDSIAGKCPVDAKTRSLWGLWKGSREDSKKGSSVDNAASSTSTIPASLEEAARHAQTPQPGQRLPLSTHRAESSIPRSRDPTTSTTPSHQVLHTGTDSHENNKTWVYPSEQQVFNAMKRKGWKGIEEESIPSFLQIHNSVNERSWKQVLEWESGGTHYLSDGIRLSRFEGRPQDLTPKAWLMSTLGVSEKPFDRHDWYVLNENEDSSEKRYVLDFYMRDSSRSHQGFPHVEIDVRPALDTPQAFWQRGRRLLREAFPGIARELDEHHTSSPSSSTPSR